MAASVAETVAQVSKPSTNPSKRAELRTQPVGRCPLCRSEKAAVLFQTADRLHGVRGMFTYKRCNSCRTVFQDPRVISEDLSLCYPLDYYTHTNPTYQVDVYADAPESSRRLSIIRNALRESIVDALQAQPSAGLRGRVGKLLARSRWFRERAFYNVIEDELIPSGRDGHKALEIGCGSGELVSKLQRVGWDIEGLEIDQIAAAAAEKLNPNRIRCGDFASLSIPVHRYDLIVMHHVFEHLVDPVAALHRITELLKPGGKAVFFYPNPGSLGARIFREAWYAWEAPRHLVFPSIKALTEAARENDLTILEHRTTTKYAEISFAYSRANKRRFSSEARVDIRTQDRILRLFEKLLISIGLRVGEEIVISFRKSTE